MNSSHEKSPTERPLPAQERTLAIELIGLTVLGVVLCIWLVSPFAAGLSWAVALCVLAAPLHEWIERKLRNSSIAAAATCLTLTIVLLVPATFVTIQVGHQAIEGIETVQKTIQTYEERAASTSGPQSTSQRILAWFRQNDDWEQEAEQLQQAMRDRAAVFFQGTAWSVINIFVCLFLLFYFLRDRQATLSTVRLLLPLSSREATLLFKRLREMIRSTLYGTLFVSALQGLLGGLMFWFLGLPGAFLWGVIMALLAVIPVLGTFVVWIPAAAYLASQGEWTKATVLVIWGALVVGLLDNWLYPIVVGKETQIHTVPMFLALVGGVAVFGTAGLVLGPMVLMSTWTLILILRDRSKQQANPSNT